MSHSAKPCPGCGSRTTLRLSGLLLATLVASAGINAQDYPEPRFPDFLPDVVADEDMLAAARAMVGREAGGGLPGYAIEPGEQVLIVASSAFDHRIVDALSEAILEAGAHPDVFVATISDFAGPTLENDAWGYLENPIFHFMRVGGRYINRILGSGLIVEQTLRAATVKDYDILIAEYDGYTPRPQLPSMRWEDLPGPSVDEFLASNEPGLPRELADKINETAWNQFRQARRVRVTDPEGTDLQWNMPADIAQIDRPARYWVEFLCMPDYLRGESLQTADSYREVDLTGVVAGTVNHVGVFPHIQVFVEDSEIVRIEGGGRFSEEWRNILAEYEGQNWPFQPGPGFAWIQECAVALNPQAFRTRDVLRYPMGAVYEHRRAGIFHWAFGVQSLRILSPEHRDYIIEHDLPDGHLDVHTKFSTMILETGAGERIVFVDKGRLTALDDPAVREVAARYGDPDTLLQDAWVPPVPGINVRGDYFADYANDPVTWIAGEYERYFEGRR